MATFFTLKRRIKGFIKRQINKVFPKKNNILNKLDQKDRELIKKIKENNLTYLSDEKLVKILETTQHIEAKNIPGIYLEAGCALGGSTILISSQKQVARKFYVFDVFGMIPPPTEEDGKDVVNRYEIIAEGKSKGINGQKYYGYENDLIQKVRNNLHDFGLSEQQNNIQLVQGLLQETMRVEEQVAFAHIDVDWYDPVKASLERIMPMLSVGGSIILDDYHDWSGCRKATDEYLKSAPKNYKLDGSSGSLSIIRIK